MSVGATSAGAPAGDGRPGVLPARLPARDRSGHKGTFGTVLVVGGSCAAGRWMSGAPALAALGALRAGAGLVRVLCPDRVLPYVVQACPSAVGYGLPTEAGWEIDPAHAAARLDEVLEGSDALVIGPGLGVGVGVSALAIRAIQNEDVPVVVDADALNALAATPELFRDLRARCVLTPHPGEFARLAGALRITASATDERTRAAACEGLAQRLGCICVLKGAGTVVSDGQRTWVCARRTPVLGTGGTGDVLAGVIGGLLAQHARGVGALGVFEAACAGVEAHALAGERLEQAAGVDGGLLAAEVAGQVPAAVASLRAGG